MIRKGLEEGPNAGYMAEAEGFAELGMSNESKALKSLFFGQVRRACVIGWAYVDVHYVESRLSYRQCISCLPQTECKKNRFGKPSQETKNLAVLGAGLMGAGIVQVSLQKGYDVIMKDTNERGLSNGYDYVFKG